MTLGIIGVGNVGTRVFKMAQSLGMRCLINDPPVKRMTGNDFYLPVEEVLGQSDIVTFHVPLITQGQDATLNMINSDFLARAKKGVILINTSRGSIMDEQAVMESIDTCNGLVLDVWNNEPNINRDLLKLVDIGTPHIAGYSYNAKLNGIDRIFKAACAFFFKEGQWSQAKVLEELKPKKITITGDEKRVYTAVQTAYPIMDDCTRFKKFIDTDAKMQGAYFDELRKKYRKRLEFSHHTVVCEQLEESEREMLSGLGFSL
jgi:erythronate-4-phosphate dehydrogenase